MALMRSMLLAASQNLWLRDHAADFPFVRRSVSRFMPGETLDAALSAAQSLLSAQVTGHYLQVLDRIHAAKLPTEVSVKLTQLGLDLSPELCFENLQQILQHENPGQTVWVDMEASNYVDATLHIYKRVLQIHPNVGICLQSYLYRTSKDLADLLSLHPSIRLVKGAYKEPPSIAFPKKSDVDQNYFALAQQLLLSQQSGTCARAAFGTHDLALIRRLSEFMAGQGIDHRQLEIQMLYGIQRAEQERLAQSGCRSVVLVAYGTYWYPWFVRRLAERPANMWFVLRNVFAS